jgi:DNA mismatch endonuclease (patch repair protein)
MTAVTLLPALPRSTAPARSEKMAAMPTRAPAPELALRRAMHAAGLRWKACTAPQVYGGPDIANRRRKVVIFVDGCWRHMCPAHYREPARGAERQRGELLSNITRDLHITDQLQAAGWLVIRVWEHEDPAEAALRIERAWRQWQR